MKRCQWPGNDELMQKYHDEEWGKPEYNDTLLFRAFILDTFQAGLSWRTILHKRENFAKVFDNFDMHKIAKYDKKKVESLMQDAGIIRNRLKIESTITNAKLAIEKGKEYGSFSKFLWHWTETPIINRFTSMKELPATTELSDKISKELKKIGFKFIGSTIIYAMMQGVGMVNDHTTDCFRYEEVINN